MSSASHDLVLFVGRFHPVLVQLPIGGLILLGILELVAKVPRFKDATQSNRLILGLTAAASITTALLGWMLSITRLRPAVVAMARVGRLWGGEACTLTFLLSWLARPRAYQLSLLVTLAVLVVASHLGASITHGRDFLTQFWPGPLRSLLRANPRPAVAPVANPDLTQRRVFADLIEPILERRCSACHGPEKHKADLSLRVTRLCSRAAKMVRCSWWARPWTVISRLLLPLDDEDGVRPRASRSQPWPKSQRSSGGLTAERL